ncbi:MAG: membrane dipeptidase, partial [Acidobacteriota bacterium]|nr:membrane dipeptidase [Acidobacteriota bacterium]
MKKSLLVLPAMAALALAAATPAAKTPEDLKARAARIHRSAIVVDTHQDVPYRLEKKWIDLARRNPTGHVDVPRLKEGGVTAPFFAAYVPAAYAESGGAAKKALETIELSRQLASGHRDLVFADSPAGVRDAKRKGKIAILIGM